MRTRLHVMVAALLLVSAVAKAQQPAPATTTDDQPTTSQVDFGWRATWYGDNSDEARHQRFQDLRNGPVIDRFQIVKDSDQWLFRVEGDRVGYRDQRYRTSIAQPGKFRVTAEWNQIPLFYSADTQTFYNWTAAQPNVLRIDDSIQSNIQAGTSTLAKSVTLANPFDLRSQRNIADLRAVYNASQHVDINLYARATSRTGNQPFNGGFGFGLADELPAPLDDRTTDLGANLEWANGRGLFRVGYDGSFYRNTTSVLTWDNPNRIADSPTAGPAQGRMALWPNNDLNAVSATGSITMAGRSTATAYVSVGTWSQNDPLIPFTINTALAQPALDRATAEAQARVTSTSFSFASRPVDSVWFNARFRSYDYDNRTPEFNVGNSINYDTSVTLLNGSSDPIGFSRKQVDLDVSFTPMPHSALRAGYSREVMDHTFRQFESSTTDTVRVSIDTTELAWVTGRLVYEHGQRRGTGLDLGEFIADGEQQGLRQFDVANRDSDRLSALLQVTPVSSFSVNLMAATGKENYPDAYFGLRNNDNHTYSIGFDFVPVEKVSLGLTYEYAKYTALQWSRTANPLPANTPSYLNDPTQGFNDPRRDWTDDSADRTDSVTASMDLLKVIPKTDIRVAYDYSNAKSTYVYGLGSATPTIPAPVQLAPVTNKLQRGTFDLQHHLTKHLAAGLVYWYDKYDVNDFALGPATINSIAQPSYLALGYVWRPYTAQTVTARLSYLW